MFKNWKKKDWYKFICNNCLIVFGSISLALGTGLFLTNLSIVSGGLSGIGIIVQRFVSFQIVDIVVWSASAVLWIIGWFFCGKEFSLRTLLSTLLYPGFLTLFLRVEFFNDIVVQVSGDGSVGYLILCGLFGGVFVGAGVALTFLGKGSTGGVDVLIYIAAKHTRIRESIWSFIIDGSIIIFSMFFFPDKWVNSLVGILSAFITALMVEFIYNANMTSYQADIISDKWEEISKYVQDTLGRGATVIRAEGGYKGEERVILRVVFEKRQFDKVANFIANTDPKAFVTYTQARAVYGEGFRKH